MDPSKKLKHKTGLSPHFSFFIEDLSDLVLRRALPAEIETSKIYFSGSSNRVSMSTRIPNPFLVEEKVLDSRKKDPGKNLSGKTCGAGTENKEEFLISLKELRGRIRELISSFLGEIRAKESFGRLSDEIIREEVGEAVINAGYQESVAEDITSFIICDGFTEQVKHYGAIDNFLNKAPLPTFTNIRILGRGLGKPDSLLFKKESPVSMVMGMVDRVAATNASVLILGETGVGKELLAKEIHRRSPRRDKPFVVVNLSALPLDLVESEMFGHEKGAFTGAVSRRTGKFELAHGGTLFLDEIGELPMKMQVKLLRFFQEKSFERVGSNETIYSDVRLITATNRDLKKTVQEGGFREDLYYRICVFPIRIPSLRERFVDIPPLAYHFMRMYSGKHNKQVQKLSSGALRALMNYNFPGNVRELENVIVRAILMADGDTIEREHLIFGSNAPSAENIPPTVSSSFQKRLDETLKALDSSEDTEFSSQDRSRMFQYLQDRKTELIRFLSLNKNKKIRNADYRRYFSCSPITARRHLKILTQCKLIAENNTNHRGRGAYYKIMVPEEIQQDDGEDFLSS